MYGDGTHCLNENSADQELGNSSLANIVVDVHQFLPTRKKANTLLTADRRITIGELELAMIVLTTLLNHLDIQKCVCVHLVPRQLTGLNVVLNFKISERDNTFFQRIITGVETWIHLCEPESKRRQWNGDIQHFSKDRNSRWNSKLEESWGLPFRMLKVLFLPREKQPTLKT